jgi:hypothetical protein|tara:strand:- start:597 stop:1049 length:453 start_codon:yes stop_codon:yes gene_type:complete
LAHHPEPSGPTLHYESSGRSGRTAVALAAWWGALMWAAAGLNASPWIIAPLACAGLPAAWDLLRATPTRLLLDGQTLLWRHGTLSGQTALSNIERVQFDTRWDFSVRIRLFLTDKTRVTLPPPCSPPHRALERALASHGIATRRNHFTFA